MSVEIGNGTELLGQFASNKGYSDLIHATAKDYPALKKFFSYGATDDISNVERELVVLADVSEDADVVSTAKALAGLIDGQDVAVITNGEEMDDTTT